MIEITPVPTSLDITVLPAGGGFTWFFFLNKYERKWTKMNKYD